ncbi:uncharacterized protein LOC134260615 isoform X1 [Saccostrea cucullata]|uniref:uncharacterized protein LOC134260615 isoform X1 n=1 Tax=Saccostrea cuccullata TaxID=36930 RepID=UPI002ED46758
MRLIHTKKYLFTYMVQVMVLQEVDRFAYGFVIPCKDSLATVTRVWSCPNNASELRKAAERKRCHDIKHTCKSFEYHCVINDWMNETIEVCAPSLLIIGGRCAEFNTDKTSIRGNYLTDCKSSTPPCPQSYNSTTSYKYFGCFSNIIKERVTTLRAVISSKNMQETSTTNTIDRIHKPSNDRSTIIISVIVPTLGLLVSGIICTLYCVRKQKCRCSLCARKGSNRRQDMDQDMEIGQEMGLHIGD